MKVKMKHKNRNNPIAHGVPIIGALLVIVAFGVVILGCKRGKSAAFPAKMKITATDYVYAGIPKKVKAGLVQATFVNKGKTIHEAWFVKVKDGTTRDSVVKELPAINRGDKFPKFLLATNGMHPVAPGKRATARFNLTPGHYFVLCEVNTSCS